MPRMHDNMGDDGREGSKGFLSIYIVLALAMFLDGLDGTIVNVALPSIAESFGILRLGFALYINLIAGQSCCKSRILTFLTDRK